MIQKKNYMEQPTSARMRQRDEAMYRKNRPYLKVCGRSGAYITVCNGTTPREIPIEFYNNNKI
jgi:hypothetical protein